MPWIVSNPIYVGRPPAASSTSFVPVTESIRYHDGVPTNEWGVLKNDTSRGLLDVIHEHGAARLLLQYTLGGTKEENPYVSLWMPAGNDIADFSRLAFRGRADRPTRIWVQLWRQVPTGNEYWRRSVYLDPVERDIVIPLAEMRPAESGTPAIAPLSTIATVVFLVDQLHTPIGTSGQIWLGDVRYQR
jgi:hypothetical protein